MAEETVGLSGSMGRTCVACNCEFLPTEPGYALCPECWAKNIRVCRDCETVFKASNGKHVVCPDCHRKWLAEQAAAEKAEAKKTYYHERGVFERHLANFVASPIQGEVPDLCGIPSLESARSARGLFERAETLYREDEVKAAAAFMARAVNIANAAKALNLCNGAFCLQLELEEAVAGALEDGNDGSRAVVAAQSLLAQVEDRLGIWTQGYLQGAAHRNDEIRSIVYRIEQMLFSIEMAIDELCKLPSLVPDATEVFSDETVHSAISDPAESHKDKTSFASAMKEAAKETEQILGYLDEAKEVLGVEQEQKTQPRHKKPNRKRSESGETRAGEENEDAFEDAQRVKKEKKEARRAALSKEATQLLATSDQNSLLKFGQTSTAHADVLAELLAVG